MDTTSDFTANFDKENSKGEAPELGLSEGAKELGGSGTKPVSGDEDVENKITNSPTPYQLAAEKIVESCNGLSVESAYLAIEIAKNWLLTHSRVELQKGLLLTHQTDRVPYSG